MTSGPQIKPFQPGRCDQGLPERAPDAYKLPHKLREPAVCPDCGVVYHAGRWQWSPAPAGAHKVVCSACHRIRDGIPAGYVSIEGDFSPARRDELLRLLRHREERARSEHPMQRIIGINETPGRIMVTTTDVHLARDLGEALHSAHDGSLDLQYHKDEDLLRVHWKA